MRPKAATADPVTTLGSNHSDPRDRRAHLLASSSLCGGALRSLAGAAGMLAAFGLSPAFAQCFSGTTGNLLTIACQAIVPTGTSSTAIGFNANAAALHAEFR